MRLTAPPVEGRANEALGRFLARTLRVRVGAIVILQGTKGRDKLVRIEGVTGEAVRARLLGAGPSRKP